MIKRLVVESALSGEMIKVFIGYSSTAGSAPVLSDTLFCQIDLHLCTCDCGQISYNSLKPNFRPSQ